MASADSTRVFELLLTITLIVVDVRATFTESNVIWGRNLQLRQNDVYYREVDEKVAVILLYESLCPDCIEDYVSQILPTIHQLGAYIDLNTYPYGNAQRSIDANGDMNITCQHGEAECYGNKLHACAIDILQNQLRYVEFNACMMPLRSNDAAANQCGWKLQIDARPIKQCAKSNRGFQLLNHYGDLSEKFSYDGVPTKLVNGNDILGKPLKQSVCNALRNPPKTCKH